LSVSTIFLINFMVSLSP